MTGDVVWTSASFDGSGNVTGTATIQANSVALGTDTTGDYVGTITGGTGIDSSGATSGEGIAHTLSIDLNELGTETSIAQDDFVAMVDATDDGSGKITFSNLEDEIFGNVSGDIAIAAGGAATIQANSVALGTDTTGDYVSTITGGTGITSTGATSGEGIAHSLSVDASQTQITSVGALDAGSITSGFGSIDVGSSAITTSGTVTGGTLAGTLSTAAQTNITSVGTLTGFTSTGIDDNADATAITIDSSENVTFTGGLVIPSTITHAGDTDTKLDFNQANTLRLITGDNTAWICSASSMVINEDSIDFDFRVESNGNANMLFVDGGNDRVGIGTASPSHTLTVNSGSSAVSTKLITTAATGYLQLDNSGGGSGIFSNSDALGFFTSASGTERMRIESGGDVGVGLTNPSTKLHIQDSDYTTMTIQAGTTGHGAILNLGDSGDIDYGSITQFASSAGEGGRMRFIAGTTETMNLRGGNVGIGTSSPSVILHTSTSSDNVGRFESTDATAYIQINDTADSFYLATGSQVGSIGGNAGVNSNNLNIDLTNGDVAIGISDADSKLHTYQSAGNYVAHFESANANSYGVWIEAGASANNGYPLLQVTSNAGSATHFRVDSGTGRVGIGTSSPASEFHVKGDAATVARVEPNDNSGKGTLLLSSTASGDGGMQYDANTNNMHLFSYSDMTFNVGTTNISGNYPANERMRIDSSGKVGIGETNPLGILHIKDGDGGSFTPNESANTLVLEEDDNCGLTILSGNNDNGMIAFGDTNDADVGTILYDHNSSVLSFTVAASERARFDASGNFLVGKSSTTFSVDGFIARSNGFSTSRTSGTVADINRNGTDGNVLAFYKAASSVGSISVTSSATAYNTSSDARLKDVTGEARGLEVINKLNPVAYNWKESGQADEGLIAQEVLDIVPNAVSQNEEDEYYQMDYSKLVTPLIKAIQEQQEQIDALQSEIQQLKGE